MKRFVVVLGLLVCSIFLAGPVLAVPVTFDFSSPESLDHSALTLRVDDLQLDLLASDARGDEATITQNTDGLGVDRGGSDAAVLDGYGVDDLLIFSFRSSVSLISVDFSRIEEGDSFTLLVDDQRFYKSALETERFDFLSESLTGERFVFSADENKADYRIRQMVVDDLSAAPVPEPSSWIVLLIGLGCLVVGSRLGRHC